MSGTEVMYAPACEENPASRGLPIVVQELGFATQRRRGTVRLPMSFIPIPHFSSQAALEPPPMQVLYRSPGTVYLPLLLLRAAGRCSSVE